MAQGLGALFITAALGPVNYAGTCIMARKVDEGLDQLTAQHLVAGMDRGIATVVAATGLPRRYVAGLLPMAELLDLSARIGRNQQVAKAQWKLHTGHIGGLLEGVADLTIDGRPPDAGLCLVRLSRKMQLDKDLAGPLRELSEDIDRWTKAIEACRLLIDDGQSLKNAYAQRRILRWGAVVAAALTALVMVIWVVRVQLARSRVAAVLEAGDPCAMDGIDESDAAKASSEQEQTIAAQRRLCEEARAEERQKEEERKREQERRRQEEEARKNREEQCSKLAARIEAGRDAEAASAELGNAALLGRIANGTLVAEDISGDIGPPPCQDTPAASRIAGRYAEAALTSAGLWLRDHTPSPSAQALAVAGKGALGERRKQVFAQSVESLAQNALRKGKDDMVAHAASVCRFAEALEAPVRQHCRATMALSSP